MLFGRFGIGGALHVSRTVLEMLLTRVSNDAHAICHCVGVKDVLVSSNCVSSFIWIELVSKNCTWKFSIFDFGMGLSILGGCSGLGDGILAISVLGGICSCKGMWSELRFKSWFVVDLYWLLFRVFIKKPSIKLFCV